MHSASLLSNVPVCKHAGSVDACGAVRLHDTLQQCDSRIAYAMYICSRCIACGKHWNTVANAVQVLAPACESLGGALETVAAGPSGHLFAHARCNEILDLEVPVWRRFVCNTVASIYCHLLLTQSLPALSGFAG